MLAGGNYEPLTLLHARLSGADRERREAEPMAEVVRWTLRRDRSVHVWVCGTGADGQPMQLPGPVLEWRREGAGWTALTVCTRVAGDFVKQWIQAEQLEPLLVRAGEVRVATDDS